MNRTLLAAVFVVAALFLGPSVAGQQIRYIVIDGTATPPAIVETNLPNADRPVITRVATGVYTLAFPSDVTFFSGTVQRGGILFDASEMLLTSVFATNDPRLIRVFTYGFSAGNPTRTFAEEGRLSILVLGESRERRRP